MEIGLRRIKISSLGTSCVLFFLVCYKKILSPILPPACRFHPTCSTYAMDSLRKHGLVKGSIMSIFRLLRCNPFFVGGLDSVPDKFSLDILFRLKNKNGKNDEIR